jgi:site-specific recombinase XerD
MVKKGTNLRVVHEAMGHKHLKTTSLYVGLAWGQMNKERQENAL